MMKLGNEAPARLDFLTLEIGSKASQRALIEFARESYSWSMTAQSRSGIRVSYDDIILQNTSFTPHCLKRRTLGLN